MAVTTSFQNSGLADVLVPHIAKDTGLDVQLLVVGTGQALRLGQAGDVDAVLVHARAAEDAFVAAGYGTHRREVMYNDFVLIGPSDDPAKSGEAQTAVEAFTAVAGAGARFVSRGDDSGTHQKERGIWQAGDFDPLDFDSWYLSVGAGMGAALNTAVGLGAYILSDRASWLNFGNKGDLSLLLAGDPILFNQYTFIPVNPALHDHVNATGTAELEAWLTSSRAAELIDGFQIGGEAPFTFNAAPRP